jgi:hypothetical protein
MMMNVKRKVALATLGVASVAGLGAGVAAAQTSPASAPSKAPVTAPAPSAKAPADTDTLQQGDQTTPDTPGASEKPGAETPDESGADTEKARPEEPGDQNLPGGGHADAPGQNVDHQFDGTE